MYIVHHIACSNNRITDVKYSNDVIMFTHLHSLNQMKLNSEHASYRSYLLAGTKAAFPTKGKNVQSSALHGMKCFRVFPTPNGIKCTQSLPPDEMICVRRLPPPNGIKFVQSLSPDGKKCVVVVVVVDPHLHACLQVSFHILK